MRSVSCNFGNLMRVHQVFDWTPLMGATFSHTTEYSITTYRWILQSLTDLFLWTKFTQARTNWSRYQIGLTRARRLQRRLYVCVYVCRHHLSQYGHSNVNNSLVHMRGWGLPNVSLWTCYAIVPKFFDFRWILKPTRDLYVSCVSYPFPDVTRKTLTSYYSPNLQP